MKKLGPMEPDGFNLGSIIVEFVVFCLSILGLVAGFLVLVDICK